MMSFKEELLAKLRELAQLAFDLSDRMTRELEIGLQEHKKLGRYRRPAAPSRH